MEANFENICEYTKTNIYEMHKNHKSVFRIFLPAFFIFEGISVVVQVFDNTRLFDTSVRLLSIIAAVLLISLGVFLYLVIPRLETKKTLKRDNELYHTTVKTNIKFYSEYIIGLNCQTNGETKTEYSQIVKIKETNHLFLLYLRANLVILVDKNGFTKGNAEEFRQYISQSVPNAKMKLKK